MTRYPICICMAGAVSAGAYSAGAMSVLLEALRRWEDDDIKLPSQPKHRIVIKGMTGASAGSIQAVLSSLDMLSAQNESNLGKEAWFGVSLDALLNAEDLQEPDVMVKSILNTGAIRSVAAKATTGFKWSENWPKYLDKEYEVRLSITNLRGIPFNLKLPQSNEVDFGTSRHAEYLRYKFNAGSQSEPDCVDHYNITVDSHKAPLLNILIEGALASSAFPFAFEPVKIKRPTVFDEENAVSIDRHDVKQWLSPVSIDWRKQETLICFESLTVPPSWNETYGEEHLIYAVDGGVINNEPILEAFKLLSENGNADWRNFPEVDIYDEANERFSGGRVILIDPFPNSLDKNISDDKMRIDRQAEALKSALIRNARFSEPLVLAKKLKERVGLVYPSNPMRDNDSNRSLPESERMLAIKSGSMSGFAGFLKLDFLEHDFELGRINMMRFLRYHFTVPTDHPLVRGDDAYIEKWQTTAKTGEQRVPIIPVYSSPEEGEYYIFESEKDDQKHKYYESKLAQYDEKFTIADRAKLKKGLEVRFGEVGKKMIFSHKPGKAKRYLDKSIKTKESWFSKTRLAKWSTAKVTEIGWNKFGKSFLAMAVLKTIENNLAKQELLAYKIYDDEGREIKYAGKSDK